MAAFIIVCRCFFLLFFWFGKPANGQLNPQHLEALRSIMAGQDPCMGLHRATMIHGGQQVYEQATNQCRMAMSAYNTLTQGDAVRRARCPLATRPGCRNLQCVGGSYRCSVHIPRSRMSATIFGKYKDEYLKNCAQGLQLPPPPPA